LKKFCPYFLLFYFVFSINQLQGQINSDRSLRKEAIRLLEISKSDPINSIPYACSADSLACLLKDRKILAETSFQLAFLYFNQSNFELSKLYFQRSLYYFEKNRDLNGISDASWHLGLIKFSATEFDSSLFYLCRCYKIEKKKNNHDKIAKTTGKIGEVFMLNQCYDEAADQFEISLKHLEGSNNNDRKAQVYVDLAYAQGRSGKTDDAIESFQKAIGFFKLSRNTEHLSFIYSHLSKLYFTKSEIENALDYKLKEFEIIQSTKDSLIIANALNSLGIAYRKAGNYLKAEQCFRKAIRIQNTHQDIFGFTASMANLGINFLESDQTDSALKYLSTSFGMADSINSVMIFIPVSPTISPDFSTFINF